MSAEPTGGAHRPVDAVAGFLAAAALFFGLLALVYQPVKTAPPAIAIALLAAGMSVRWQRLAQAAIAISSTCFVLGMIVAVLANKPLW